MVFYACMELDELILKQRRTKNSQNNPGEKQVKSMKLRFVIKSLIIKNMLSVQRQISESKQNPE